VTVVCLLFVDCTDSSRKDQVTAMLTAKIEKNELVIRIPINSVAVPSSSGKTLIVASSRGPITTAAEFDGKAIIVNFNAYVSSRG
jgi:hypothetical protein